MAVVHAELVSAQTFAPFGDVIAAELGPSGSANQGTAVRYDSLARFENLRPHAVPSMAVYRSTPCALPFKVKLLERHPKSTQLFVPMKVARYLVVVAPDDAAGGPDLSRLRAFLFGPGQGVNYRAGLWHHPIVALESEAEFAMLAWIDGTALDCEERPLDRDTTVHLR